MAPGSTTQHNQWLVLLPGTQRNLLHAPLYHMTCYLHPEMPVKPVPCVSRTHGFHSSMGNKDASQEACFPEAGKACFPEAGNQAPEFLLPADLVPLSWQQLPRLLVVSTSKQAPGTPLPTGLISSVLAAAPLDCAPENLANNLQNSCCHRLGFPMPAGLLHCSPETHARKQAP
jgi:hypothetical protein